MLEMNCNLYLSAFFFCYYYILLSPAYINAFKSSNLASEK